MNKLLLLCTTLPIVASTMALGSDQEANPIDTNHFDTNHSSKGISVPADLTDPLEEKKYLDLSTIHRPIIVISQNTGAAENPPAPTVPTVSELLEKAAETLPVTPATTLTPQEDKNTDAAKNPENPSVSTKEEKDPSITTTAITTDIDPENLPVITASVATPDEKADAKGSPPSQEPSDSKNLDDDKENGEKNDNPPSTPSKLPDDGKDGKNKAN
jgi:hypothetical protein